MIVGVPRESYPGERRVALVPLVVPGLLKAGLQVVVEAGAGVAAGYPDADYSSRGARCSQGVRMSSGPPTSSSRSCATVRTTGPAARICPCFARIKC